MHKGSNKRRTNTSRDILISRLARKYHMRWMDAYYCCEIIDFTLDRLMAMGMDVTIKDILDIRIDIKKVDNPEQLEDNRKYIKRVLKGRERFYHYKHHWQKSLRFKR